MKVLANQNVMDYQTYVTETAISKKQGSIFQYPFINSEFHFSEMTLDPKNIFVNGDNFNLDILIDMVKKLKPYKITHLRIEGQIYYKTIFQSDNKVILVDGQLTSGYSGHGPSDFAKVLYEIGFDDDTLERYIFTRTGDECIETTFILPDNV
ncbi:hypothetical protein [Staphylococcus gallinarum]|uniref:hypothetical protein n=1 Tax=Staphylococcus gallinarum TaxID=1293 RepID=UPI001E2EA9BB|nr:hypothetical protein [Staphylococcus gallinarum]MCD8845193.1 hypothetical protein [Staphylococcus gallinarum]